MNDWKSSVPQDDNIFIKFKAQAYPTNQLPQEGIFQSKVMQILAKTKFSIEPGIDMNYYNANYSTPAELPDEVYDRSKKYYRNRLGLYKNHLIVPRSETGNILRIYDLKFDKPKSTIRLSTPITQIVANGKKMLVKTMGHVYCLNENFLDSEMLTAEVSDMFSFLNFGMEPLHIASSRIINEAIVLLPNGDVNIWDLHSNASSKWGDLILFGKDNTSSRLEPSEIHFDPTEYFTCEFATHPKQILLSNGDFAILGDLRSNSLNNPILYQASDNEKIADLKANPFIPYQVALAIGSKVILRDSRFLKKSLLQWNYGNAKETRTFLEFGSANDIYTWGQTHADVYLYQFSPDTCPKSVNFQSCKPFYSHPSFSQDPYPVPFVFISGNTLQQELIKRSVTNPWPNMVGFAVNNSGDQSDLYYLNDELALYATSCSKSPITEDNLRWIELDSKSRSDTQKLVDNYKFPPRFEGNHEYLQIENVLGKAQSSIADAIENDPPNVEVECKFDQIESLYDVYARTLNKIDYTTTESGALPSLSGLSTENFKSFLDQTIIDLPTDGLMLNANLEQIKADIAKLPQRNSLQFPDGTTEFAQNLLEQDLVLSNTVVIPRADTRALVEFDDGSHSGHQSSVASPLWDGNINFKGIPSWLFDLWGKENPMGDMQLESDDGWSSGKSEYSSGVSGGQSDTSSMGSARRVRIKRNIEESSSGFVPLTLPVPELVQTAPPLVRSASQPTPKHTAVKKKRKIGF